MPNPTKNAARLKDSKPQKPHRDFPLYWHSRGGWTKKVRGKSHYFGKDAVAALDEWLRVKDDLLAGRPSQQDGQYCVGQLMAGFLASKRHQRDEGELTPRSYSDYKRTCETVLACLGKERVVEFLRPDDFAKLRSELAVRLSPVSLHNEMGRVRVVFNYAFQNYHIDKPIRYGDGFKRPTKRTLRTAKAKGNKRFFDAAEIQTLLKAATDPKLRAMILLGVNCGLGNADCGNLERRHINLDAGWMDYPRPKTGIDRRCWLWQETVDAIRDALERRTEPKDEADTNIVFVTKYGQRFFKNTKANPLSAEFRKLTRSVGVYRKGVSFYALRHTFETIAGGSKDQVAVDAIMGHVDESMAANYRQHIDDDRLQAVAEHVRAWLFGGQK